jgi:hypothetical protein
MTNATRNLIDSDPDYKRDGQKLFDVLQSLESELVQQGATATAADVADIIENTGYYAAARIWRCVRGAAK